jgi:ATP-dependent Clp protease ATP-binding subunit ClpC
LFERFTKRARQVVVLAQDEARELKHNYIGTEHLLLGLLREEEGIAARVLESLDVTLEEVRTQVIRIVGPGDEGIPGQIPFTPRAKKTLELALRESQALGHRHIGTEHILLGLVRANEGVAVDILRNLDVDFDKIGRGVAQEIGIRGGRPSSARLEADPAELHARHRAQMGRRPGLRYAPGRMQGAGIVTGWLLFGVALGLGVLVGWAIWGL